MFVGIECVKKAQTTPTKISLNLTVDASSTLIIFVEHGKKARIARSLPTNPLELYYTMS